MFLGKLTDDLQMIVIIFPNRSISSIFTPTGIFGIIGVVFFSSNQWMRNSRGLRPREAVRSLPRSDFPRFQRQRPWENFRLKRPNFGRFPSIHPIWDPGGLRPLLLHCNHAADGSGGKTSRFDGGSENETGISKVHSTHMIFVIM